MVEGKLKELQTLIRLRRMYEIDAQGALPPIVLLVLNRYGKRSVFYAWEPTSHVRQLKQKTNQEP